MNIRTARILGGVLLAMVMAADTTVAQQRVMTDLDPATRMIRNIHRKAQGPVTITGAGGPLNYAAPTPVTEDRHLLPDLFTRNQLGAEPLDSLLLYQTRGQRIDINWEFLDGLNEGQQARALIPLFDGEEMELVFVASEHFAPLRYNWVGQIAGVAASDFVLSRYEDVIHMVIRDYQHHVKYEVQYAPEFGDLAAGMAIRKIGDVGPAMNWCATCSGPGCGHADSPRDPAPEPPSKTPGGEGGDNHIPDPTNQVDVLIICTAQARAGYGNNPSAFHSQAQNIIGIMNLIAQNSQVNLQFRLMSSDWDLAGTYSEDPDGHIDLAWLRFNGGAFAATHSARNDRRADVVALIRQNPWGASGGIGGVAEWMGTATTSEWASVNSRNHQLLGLDEILPHEIGHNMGACHNLEASQPGCPGTSFHPAPYGKFLVCNVACWDRWQTIMGYKESTCSGLGYSSYIPFFSNPNVTFHPGGACPPISTGGPQQNVAGLLNTTRASISQNRIAATQTWVSSLSGLPAGTFHNPYMRVVQGVANVLGGAAEARVRILGRGTANPYNETAANNNQPVTLSNPGTLQKWGQPNEPDVVIR